MDIYVVKNNDTVDSIAANYGVDANDIIYNNQLAYPYALAVGQALLIVTGERNPVRTIKANGYAYPYISKYVLEQTLPYLTELSVFSYGFTTDGDLVPPKQDDTFLIESAEDFSTNPILTLTPIGPDGNFNDNLITALVYNQEAIDNLIDQLLVVLEEKRYRGVDIDFEYIGLDNRDAFTSFVRQLTERLKNNGYAVSIALAPKTSANQKGVLYEGKDYKALGEITDSVLLMTYEWGFKYGPPMAVAPLNMVKRVVDYAITEIDTAKINLGIPNYGYDWPLPFVKGETVATTIGNVEAVQIAIENNAEIKFDETAQCPYFEYEDNDGIQHVVWFDDVRSYQKKFQLIIDYNLRGLGYWQIMRLFRAGLLLQNETFDIVKTD